jgi:hypothetical protein
MVLLLCSFFLSVMEIIHLMGIGTWRSSILIHNIFDEELKIKPNVGFSIYYLDY